MKIEIWDREKNEFMTIENILRVYNGVTYIGITYNDGRKQELKTTTYRLEFIFG